MKFKSLTVLTVLASIAATAQDSGNCLKISASNMSGDSSHSIYKEICSAQLMTQEQLNSELNNFLTENHLQKENIEAVIWTEIQSE